MTSPMMVPLASRNCKRRDKWFGHSNNNRYNNKNNNNIRDITMYLFYYNVSNSAHHAQTIFFFNLASMHDAEEM